MSKLALWCDQPYQQDEIFNSSSYLNRDDCLAPFRALKERFQKEGWEVHSYDLYKSQGETPSAIIFLDRPSRGPKKALGPWYGNCKTYLLIQECEVVKPKNWILPEHGEYTAIFTWHDEFVDGDRYLKLNFPQSLSSLPEAQGTRPHFATLIAGNKLARHPFELYSKRIEAIRWFENHHPEDFHFYGMGWDRPVVHIPITLLSRIFKSREKVHYSSYRGAIENKDAILKQYKFSICFENAHSIPGYITEKIFDCLASGSIPVYWGAPNIESHVDKDCFIDFREFKSFDTLYEHLSQFSEADLINYRENAIQYLKSEKAKSFSTEAYVDTLSQRILADA